MLAVSPEDIDSFLSSTTHARIDTALFTTGKRVSRTQSTPIAISVPPGDVNIYDSWKHVNAKLADLEMACWEDNVGDHYTQMIQSPALRAPEVCIGAGWGKPADIWSIACLAYQLSMGKSLITPNCDSDAVPFFQALYFGNLPMHMLKRGAESSKFYKDDGTLKIELPGRLSVEEMVLKQPPGRARMLVDFLKRAFVLDPEQRPTARELLAHEWVQPS
ncbi:hypothetical protein PsYK624_058100 [Phanerochaete sordida]|uniref:non-specific serine/threonine protein kinase n=1 Tax=Phanerochaete sordida TaxID=48140 RepID=A0A9P3G975_9APHY|nr:hypothetical protein PsYK624_058100 [Phanerochaete sordida]